MKFLLILMMASLGGCASVNRTFGTNFYYLNDPPVAPTKYGVSDDAPMPMYRGNYDDYLKQYMNDYAVSSPARQQRLAQNNVAQFKVIRGEADAQRNSYYVDHEHVSSHDFIVQYIKCMAFLTCIK